MKIYYLNDEKRPIRVFYHYGLTGEPAVLQPAQGAFFEVNIPEGRSPFIKKWNDYVMISDGPSDMKEEKVYVSDGKPPWNS